MTLEDEYNDIIAKAQNGLGLSNEDVCRSSGLSSENWRKLKGGKFNEFSLRAVAKVLGLAEEPLVKIAKGVWRPKEVQLPSSIQIFKSPYHGMIVNSYLMWDERSKLAAAFDTGTDASGMLEVISKNHLKLEYLFLTHAHGDHIFEMDRVLEKTGAKAYIGDREPLDGAVPFHQGDQFECGSLKISTRLTYGHSAGGITYLIEKAPLKIAVVGDALFAGSMGGGLFDYQAALNTNRKEIFSLPDSTILFPGHGPLTTVGEEKVSNPFFA